MLTNRHAVPVVAATTALVLLGAGTAHASGSDEAAGAHKFRNLPFSDTTDVSQATSNATDPDFPDCPDDPANSTVWYRFQPKSDTTATIDTLGSDYDTVLAVYRAGPGQSARDLTPVVCNDDTFGLQSEVQFQAERNRTYFIVVDTFSGGPAGTTLQLNAH